MQIPALAQAAAPITPIALHHAAWTAGDGAPQAVLTMAQTSDGWLWLGGPNGLFRFDGARFERYADPDAPMPANSISILSAQPSGGLWIGYRFGGASLLADGKLRNYDHQDGLPRTSVWGVQADGAGRVWAATHEGMFHLDGQRWHRAGADWGLRGVTYKTLMRDRHGVLWAQGDQGIYTLAPGAARFVERQPDSGVGVVMEVPDGSVWSWDGRVDRLSRLTPPAQGVRPRRWTLHGNVGALLFDRAGDLWAGFPGGVEYHTERGVWHTGPQHGLSGGAVTAMLEDREGNIWAATANGIDRFRRQRIAKVTMTEPGPKSLAADSDGGMYTARFHVARPDQGPTRATELWPSSPVALHNFVVSSYRDAGGVLWSGGYGGLWRKDGARVTPVSLPGAITGGQFNAIVRDRDGGLWISIALHGVFRLGSDGAWKKMDGVDGLPAEPARAMADAGAGLWLGYSRSRLLQQHGDGWRSYGPDQGVRLGMVMALHLRGEHVWAGGENGLALRQGQRFIGVTGADGQGFEGVTGIVELPDGDLWLNAVSGLYRLPAAEIARLAASPGYRVRYQRLDSLDGLDGSAQLLLPSPSLALATDGKLWLSTTTGVFGFDPARRAPPAPAPPVLIRRIGAPGAARSATAGMRLAPGTAALQVDYTAIALAMPERLRFRYRLDGVDAQWQDAGNRRAAYYNNLDAGPYRFQVQAADEDGAWNGPAATLDFSIAPTATQSWWFKSLCALALLALCWAAYRLRVRQLVAQMAGRMEERLGERERIARELHDTLLQSVQGLILHVHAATMRLPEPEPARALIEQALERADDVLHEGRDRVRDLRHDGCEQGLAGALAAAAEHARTPESPPLRLVVSGAPRKLRPLVHQEVLAIAAEAIANAYRHANATTIEAHLLYRSRDLRLSIRDNGAGIARAILEAGGREHHWGMHGMRERAAHIKARLVLRSESGAGTECLIVVPGSLAYNDGMRRFWLRRRAA